MKKLKHIQNKQKSSLTFVIIPNSSQNMIQFTLPEWLPKTLALALTLVLFTSILFASGYFATRYNLSKAEKLISKLKQENHAQSLEIADLKSYSVKVDEKLADLNKIQSQVLDMVGLYSDENSRESAKALLNYSLPSYPISRGEHLNFLPSQGQGYEEEINFLTELIDREKTNMENLIVDVEKQLEYINALPNLLPNEGRISSPFGYRTSPTGRRREFHNGVDIANKSGSNITAAGSGIVTFSDYNGGYGRMLIISHGYGYTSIYAHNQKNLVSVGDKVEKGQVIAQVGSTGRSTGPHVHFEVRLDNEPIDPLSLIED